MVIAVAIGVVVTSTETGVATNASFVEADQFDPYPENDADVTTVVGDPSTDVGVEVTVSDPLVEAFVFETGGGAGVCRLDIDTDRATGVTAVR